MARKRPRRRKATGSNSITAEAKRAAVRPEANGDTSSAIQSGTPAPSAARSSTAVTEKKAPLAGAAIRRSIKKSRSQSDAEKWVRRIVGSLGSLKLAVPLLAIFAVVVLMATWMEHAFGTPAAQGLVYKSWWFGFLMAFLAINILFAAVKKMKFATGPPNVPRGSELALSKNDRLTKLLGALGVIVLIALTITICYGYRIQTWLGPIVAIASVGLILGLLNRDSVSPVVGMVLTIGLITLFSVYNLAPSQADAGMPAGSGQLSHLISSISGSNLAQFVSVVILILVGLLAAFSLFDTLVLQDRAEIKGRRTAAVISHFWPWQRHQFGFIVTHIGLLTMLFGGVLNYFGGTDALLQLIDTNDPQILNAFEQRFGDKAKSQSNECVYADISQIRVTENAGRDAGPEEVSSNESDFYGGLFPWKSAQLAQTALSNPLLFFLDGLSAPIGRSWSMGLGDGARLEVINFLPFARQEEFSPAKKGEGSAAFKLQLKAEKGMMRRPQSFWLTFDPGSRQRQVGAGMPILIETLGTVHSQMLPEFLNPPSTQELGKKGVLAVYVGGKHYRVPVDEHWKRNKTLGNSGWSVRLTEFDKKQHIHLGQRTALVGQSVVAKLERNGQVIAEVKVFAKLVGASFDVLNKRPFRQGEAGNPFFWYHQPDVTGGEDNLRGIMQFVRAEGNQLLYRTFTQNNKQYALERSGAVDMNHGEQPIWDKMEWQFRIVKFLPNAIHAPRFVAVNIGPSKNNDKDRLTYPRAIQCRLTVRDKSRVFWMQRGRILRNVVVGGRSFDIRYSDKTKNLGFTLKLERAEQTTDAGSGAAASYTSHVLINDEKRNIHNVADVITMNKPLEHNGFTFYQSTYNYLDVWDARDRPVSLSGFTVARDPGIGFKYAGSVFLAAGIFIMFYMKAYFFRSRPRTPNAA